MYLRIAAAAALIMACTASPAGGQSGQSIGRFTGDPYTGWVTARIVPPDGETQVQYGEGSAYLERTGAGKAKLVVFGAIADEKGDASFMVEGSYDARGWRGGHNGVSIRISPAGAISGGGVLPPQRFRFGGQISASEFDLDVDLTMQKATRGGFPPGTRFEFEYRLSRRDPTKEAAEQKRRAELGKRSSKKCRSIRWEMRPVANMFGGPMDMVRVPVCLSK